MAETYQLPEDVIMNILCWLPVISLIRFTSVSKRWRFIILSDPKFAASHFNAARQRKTLRSSRVLLSTGAPQLESHDTALFGKPSSSARKLGLPFEQRGGRVTLLGSCNGLVFVAFGDSYFFIWNPVTRFFKELPGPGLPGGELWCYGAGYLSATDDYRVVATSSHLEAIIDESGYDYVETVYMKMFSSKANVWKTIQPYRNDGTIDPYRGTLLNEALHWVHRVQRDEILAFDLALEEFRTMGLPGDEQYRHHIQFHYVGCSEFEGFLCVCGYDYVSGFQDSMDFWVMREYGVLDSWTKLFQFYYTPANPFSLFMYTESCEVAIQGEGDMNPRWLLVEIDHKQEEHTGVYLLQRLSTVDRCLSIIPYEESLLRIDD